LIVDWGGVLTASLDVAMARWAEQDGVDYRHFRAVMRDWVGGPAATPVAGRPAGPFAVLEQAADDGPARESPVHRLERGQIGTVEFERELARQLTERGSPVRPDGLLGRLLGGLAELEDDMVALVGRARDAGLRTALLSNSWGDHYPDQLWSGLFDDVVISGRVGLRKPEPAIFELTCDRLGLEPAQCVMVDDLSHNVRGAVAVGMVGVLHTSYQRTAEELSVLFGLPLGLPRPPQ
jgi:epoxide hydrolase-like predicted phosphatase